MWLGSNRGNTMEPMGLNRHPTLSGYMHSPDTNITCKENWEKVWNIRLGGHPYSYHHAKCQFDVIGGWVGSSRTLLTLCWSQMKTFFK